MARDVKTTWGLGQEVGDGTGRWHHRIAQEEKVQVSQVPLL